MIPKFREIYDVSRDVAKIFPDEFKKYVAKQKLLCYKHLLPVSDGILWAFEKEHQHADSLTLAEYRHVVDAVIRSIEYPQICLIQFWRAEEMVVNSDDESRFLLTTNNQPFLLGGSYLPCRYRMKMHDVIVNGDGRGGAIGRVFRNSRMEFTPYVSFYADNEYPQRDIAMSCDIESSLVLPWLDSSGRVVGAIECVSPPGVPLTCRLPSSQLPSSPIYSDHCVGLCGQYKSEKDSLITATSEIKEKIGEVCKRCDLVGAQIWMLCRHCNSLSTIRRCTEGLDDTYEFYSYDMFFLCEDYYNLQKGEGVVGKAAESSYDLVYCEDVAKFSIIEYPLAHFACYYGLSASFSICLRSYQTGDQVYVLEFFLDSNNIEGKNIRERLVPILEIMRQLFMTFKFASGGNIGDSLSVQVIDANSPDKVETLRNKKLDLTLTLGLNNDKTFEYLQNLERFGGRGESSRPSFLQRSTGESSTEEIDDPMIGVETSLQGIVMEDPPVASASTVQCEIRVTIKATYGVTSISFQLSTSSGIHELYDKVSQRLQLAYGTYDLKYLDDENDLIELICDEDLQMYISTSTEHENYTLLVFVVPR